MAQQALPYTIPDITNNEAWKRTGEMFTDLFSLQSQIISAGDARFADPVLYPTVESKISAARVQAAVELKTIVSIPAVMIPHNTALVDYTNASIRNVREGGDYSVYDILAYGADNLGVLPCTAACLAAHAGAALTHGTINVPPGIYSYDGKMFDILTRLRIRGGGKRSTFFRPTASYSGYAITLTDCWKNAAETADTATVDLALTKAGVILEGFTIVGNRTNACRGIATYGLVDFFTIKEVDLICLNGTALSLGRNDTVSTQLGCIRESYFQNMTIGESGNLSEPAFDLAGSATARIGDGSNDLTFHHLALMNNKGVHWLIEQANAAETLRGINVHGFILNGDGPESVSPTAADLMQIKGHVEGVEIDGAFISGSSTVSSVRYAAIRVSSNAAGTPDRIKINGDLVSILGDGYVIDNVNTMQIKGTASPFSAGVRELVVAAGAFVGSGCLQYDVISQSSVGTRQGVISIGDEAAAARIFGSFREGTKLVSTNDSSPDVRNVALLEINDSTTNNITDFDFGGMAQELTVSISTANVGPTTLKYGSPAFLLRGGQDRVVLGGEVIRFIHNGSSEWREVGGNYETIDGWLQDNVAASQTDVELTRAVGRFRAVRGGSVTGLVVASTLARTAGTLTVKVFKNTGLADAAGAQLATLTAVLNASNTSRASSYLMVHASNTFVAGDGLYITVTTDGAWLPTTAGIRCALEIAT
jgi:hypothetical protein